MLRLSRLVVYAGAVWCVGSAIATSASDGPPVVTLLVDHVGDGDDAIPGDGRCATAAGSCTLRAALQEVNATQRMARIAFAIAGDGPHTIALGRALPAIDVRGGRVTIDATEQSGSRRGDLQAGIPPRWAVRVDAGGLPEAGLRFQTPASVRGLEVFGVEGSNTAGYAIQVGGANSVVEGCYVHDSWGGIVAQGAGTTIGGPAPGQGNVASGNALAGITVFGGVAVRGNVIGLDPTGMVPLPEAPLEARNEIGVYVEGGSANHIGGPAGARNVIAGNAYDAIFIKSGVTGTVISNNDIGLDRLGVPVEPCTIVDDRGAGTVYGASGVDDNRYCSQPPPAPGCCAFTGEELPVTCLDATLAPVEISESFCAELTDEAGGPLAGAELVHFNAAGRCDEAGVCPPPHMASPTAVTRETRTATPPIGISPAGETPSPTTIPPRPHPPADCSGDGAVSIAELIIGVTIAVGTQPIAACPAADVNGDGQVTIDELILAITAALDG